MTDHLSETVRPIAGTREQVVEQLRQHLDTGVDGMILSCAGEDRNAEYVELLGDVAKEAFA